MRARTILVPLTHTARPSATRHRDRGKPLIILALDCSPGNLNAAVAADAAAAAMVNVAAVTAAIAPVPPSWPPFAPCLRPLSNVKGPAL